MREKWMPPSFEKEKIKTGDMPGDKVLINDNHVKVADAIFPDLIKDGLFETKHKNIISIYGGSGVGKSEIASVIAHYCSENGYPAYILSGDNYPHRFPGANDIERLRIFRSAGLSAVAKLPNFQDEWMSQLKKLMPDMSDLLPSPNQEAAAETGPSWLEQYRQAGRDALYQYLGTEREIDFDLINFITSQFKSEAQSITLKRMGRSENEIYLQKIDFSGIRFLIIEWTHGNNPLLKNVDYPVFLYSTPSETRAHRLERKRDTNTDTPLIQLVLDLEHKKLLAQTEKAKQIVSKNGTLLSLSDIKE